MPRGRPRLSDTEKKKAFSVSLHPRYVRLVDVLSERSGRRKSEIVEMIFAAGATPVVNSLRSGFPPLSTAAPLPGSDGGRPPSEQPEQSEGN